MDSSKLLKTLRLNLGLTQRELAKKLGTTQQAITLIEGGHRGIPKSMMKSLWDVYKIPCYSVLDDSFKEKQEENALKLLQSGNNEISEEKMKKTFKVNIIATVECENKKELLKLIADSFLQDIEMLDIMEAKYKCEK